MLNSEAILNVDVSGTHDDKSTPLQVEVEIKHKLKRKKHKRAKNKIEEPLPLQENIALDAPSNAAVEKVKKRKKTQASFKWTRSRDISRPTYG